jgi:hypothetical protein
MDMLKHRITSAPALMAIDYKSGLMVFLGVDVSQEGAGVVIKQVGYNRKRHPV